MKWIAGVLLTALACLTLPVLAAGTDANALTICLNKDNAPFSFKSEGKEGGFDLTVAQALARQLNKPLEIKWYEKERRKKGSVSVKASVMVTAGVFQLVGGYPLIQSSLDRGASGVTTTLPPIDGIAPEDRKQSLSGNQLFASQGYHFAGMTPILVTNVTQSQLTSLDELKPYRMGNRPASMGDLIAMAYKQGLLAKNLIHVDIQFEPLDLLSKSEFDVTILEMHRFDIYRNDHPQTTLRASGLILPVGFNLGFVTTDAHADLLKAVNGALDVMAKNGELEKAARSAGLTYIPALFPAVSAGMGLEKIMQ